MVNIPRNDEVHGDIPNIHPDLLLHFTAKAGKIINIDDIQTLSDQERGERAGAMMIDIAKIHFEANPESEYIDFIQLPEYGKITKLLTIGKNVNIRSIFEYMGKYVESHSYKLHRPSHSYFTSENPNINPDFFGISKPLLDGLDEKRSATQLNRDTYGTRKAA